MFQPEMPSRQQYLVDDFAKNCRLWVNSAFSQELRDLKSRLTQVQVFVLVRDFGKDGGLLIGNAGTIWL